MPLVSVRFRVLGSFSRNLTFVKEKPTPFRRATHTSLRIAALLSVIAFGGCVKNPLGPEPRLEVAGLGAGDISVLEKFDANLQLTAAIATNGLRAPGLKDLVDVQIAAMHEHFRKKTGLDPALLERKANLDVLDDNGRLARTALVLLPYLHVDSGEQELARVAGQALAVKLGRDAQYEPVDSSPPHTVDFAADWRDGVGVLRLRNLLNGMAQRALPVLNQWAASPSAPRAVLLDVSECESADANNTTELVNAFAPGRTVLELEYRVNGTERTERSAWRGDAGWGIAALEQVPLFIWVSGRTSPVVEAAAAMLREERSATLLGDKTAGTGRHMSWTTLAGDHWFGYTVSDVLDAHGARRELPLFPDACTVRDHLELLEDRTARGYDAQCSVGSELGVEAVLKYVTAATSPRATP